MQASMASCQGSSSASGKVTSRDRILRGDRSGKADIQSWPEVPPVPKPAPPSPSPQHSQVQGLVGGRSVQALHQRQEGLRLPLKLQQAWFDLVFLGSLRAQSSLQFHKQLPRWAQALHQMLQSRAGTLRRGFFGYRNRGTVRIGQFPVPVSGSL